MNTGKELFPHLLSPGRIGNLELKNRVVMGPTETLYATSDGEVTDKIIDYYTARAKGGCGLITVHSAQGATKVDKIDPYPGSIRVDDNMYVPMLSDLPRQSTATAPSAPSTSALAAARSPWASPTTRAARRLQRHAHSPRHAAIPLRRRARAPHDRRRDTYHGGLHGLELLQRQARRL